MSKQTYKRKDEEVIDALRKSRGIMSDACRILGLKSVTSFRERVKKYPQLLSVVEEEREKLKDTAESIIGNSLEIDRNVETAKWYLRSLAKDRGYGESLNVNATVAVQPVDLSKLSNDELKQLEELLTKTGG